MLQVCPAQNFPESLTAALFFEKLPLWEPVMHKLVILLETPQDENLFEAQWPLFLHWAERIPGLRREVSSRVAHQIFGAYPCFLIHEMFFDDQEAARKGLASKPGTEAGKVLQQITGGRITLLIAAHQEDTPENFQLPPLP